MQIKFPSELFEWIKSECGEVSPAAFVVKTLQDKQTGSKKGATNEQREETNDTERHVH